MQINKETQDVISRISKSSDGKYFVSFLKDLVSSTADVRKLLDITPEGVKGRQLACAIIEDEIISRFLTTSKGDINKEDYE